MDGAAQRTEAGRHACARTWLRSARSDTTARSSPRPRPPAAAAVAVVATSDAASLGCIRSDAGGDRLSAAAAAGPPLTSRPDACCCSGGGAAPCCDGGRGSGGMPPASQPCCGGGSPPPPNAPGGAASAATPTSCCACCCSGGGGTCPLCTVSSTAGASTLHRVDTPPATDVRRSTGGAALDPDRLALPAVTTPTPPAPDAVLL